jgi:hypothetical protein
MGGWGSIKAILGGSLDEGEFGKPDVLRRTVDGIMKLRRHADRGVELLPPEVEVTIQVAEGSVQLIERFVEDPVFDREVEAELRNRLVNVPEGGVPARRYFVQPGKKTEVTVVESRPRSYQLRVLGGDRDGAVIGLPAAKRDFLLGRGQWHGEDQNVANDVVVSEGERTISRKAARLHRVGSGFELQASDQREALAVLRPDGQRLRPALAASGRVPVKPGDLIEFTDGNEPVLTLRLEEM